MVVSMSNANIPTERLIKEVRARPPLWDQRNLNYHNRVVVNALWQDIADSMQINSKFRLPSSEDIFGIRLFWQGTLVAHRGCLN